MATYDGINFKNLDFQYSKRNRRWTNRY